MPKPPKPLLVIGLPAAVLLVLFVAMQLVPVEQSNPPASYDVAWDSAETEMLMRAACYDCHSHETVWPWYSRIAPASWLIAHDVSEGRQHMNLSTGYEVEAQELIEEIERGSMPLPIYLPLHPEARLTDAQRAQLIVGIETSLGDD